MYIYIYIDIHSILYVYIRIYIEYNIYVYIYIYTYMYICTCMCIRMWHASNASRGSERPHYNPVTSPFAAVTLLAKLTLNPRQEV